MPFSASALRVSPILHTMVFVAASVLRVAVTGTTVSTGPYIFPSIPSSLPLRLLPPPLPPQLRVLDGYGCYGEAPQDGRERNCAALLGRVPPPAKALNMIR
ncbi:hypothetical protein C8R44DRAFT_752983 [Mycena epipterygia]|nr:hypothetical protein C8R44DRAFT_752983 [Mycena epipterygia]